ncbi:MAG: iron-sulfur cluster assembly protein [bacterium]|nr:iron-sulfur cluster assembly protein [bacterium]
MSSELEAKIMDALKKVIDPETELDVIRMKLIRDLKVEDEGHVSLTLRFIAIDKLILLLEVFNIEKRMLTNMTTYGILFIRVR